MATDLVSPFDVGVTSASGGLHEHIDFLLLGNGSELPSAGVYLLTLRARMPGAGFEPLLQSPPFWIVFGHDVTATVRDQAVAWVEDNLVDADTDGDGVPDAEDNCAGSPNSGQENFDGDALGDACDSCATIVDAGSDSDMDGVDQACDTCSAAPNPVFTGSLTSRTRVSGQLDDDADGRGNACDFDFDNLGSVVAAGDFSNAKVSVGKLVTATNCGVSPAGQRCGEFDHDLTGGVITAGDFNLVKAAVGKLIATSYPTCAACAVGPGWSNTPGSGGERLGRPICQSTVVGACAFAP
jgi:hypothetical protein